MDSAKQLWEKLQQWFNAPLLTLGEAQLTLLKITYLLLLVIALFYVSGKLKQWMRDRLLTRTHLDLGARNAIGTITRYVIVVFGFLVIFQTVGINLTTLSILTGAVGIGLGFGLQNIANNFVSGVIILFEQPIKVGDRINIGTADGRVTKIGPRSTTVLTNDNTDIIIPNSKLITDNVINLSHSSPFVRFHVPVTVANGSNLARVKELLLAVARENPNVMTTPAPSVAFVRFGTDGFDLELLVWTETMLHSRLPFFSELNFAIYESFRTHEIETPNPQRDIYIRGGLSGLGGAADAATPSADAKVKPD